jgi:hypothetical protein
MTPETEIERLFSREYAQRLKQTPRPDRVQMHRPLTPIRAREYERQEMADGRERYATGDHSA